MHEKIARERPELADRVWALVNLFQARTFLACALEERIGGHSGLSLAEQEVLLRLDGHGHPLAMHELADLLLFSKSGVTRLVDRLEESELVRRQPSSEDRRITYAVMTDQGRRALEGSLPVFAQTVQEVFGRLLSDGEVRSLRRILRKLLEANGQWDERRCARHTCSSSGRSGKPLVDPAD